MASVVTRQMFVGLQGKQSSFSPSGAEIPSASESLITDYLYRVQDSGALQQRKYVLTKTRFIESQPQNGTKDSVMEADIRWCTVEPRFRNTRLCVHYGFAIIYQHEEIVFFASSDSACDEWLQKLGSVAILRNIENAYVLGKVRENHKLYTRMDGFSIDTGEQVTIKQIFKSQLLRSPRRCQSLAPEIQILRSISHPLIAKLYHVYESDDNIYLVFERLEGTLLSESIAERRFSDAEATGFIINLLTVLNYLEGKSILHRDIRPCNFLLTSRNDRSQFKIISFSIAREYSSSGISDSLGSPGFIAPEVLSLRQYGPAADIYSAGILLYMLIAGKNPFETSRRQLLISRNAKSEISFGAEWAQVDLKLVSLVQIMTNVDPERRQSAARLKSMLQRHSKKLLLPQLSPDLLMTAEMRKSFDVELLKNRSFERSFMEPPRTPLQRLPPIYFSEVARA